MLWLLECDVHQAGCFVDRPTMKAFKRDSCPRRGLCNQLTMVARA